MTLPPDPGFFADPGGDTPAHARAEEVTPPPPPPPVRRRMRPVRMAVLSLILLTTVGVGVADRAVHRVAAATQPTPVSSVAPVDVESSSWYCEGGTAAPGSAAVTSVDLVNTTGVAVSGTLSAVSDTGVTKSEAISVPALSQIVEVPGQLTGGNFVATSVDLNGGGVLVTESVAGPFGWSVSPCSRSTAPVWYFASGSTINGNTITLSLFNPTTTDAVVDMTFVTPAGISVPQPFEGVLVPPGQLVVLPVASYVQDATSVSTIATARSGAIVASELESTSTGGVSGLSLRLGVPNLFARWVLPETVDIPGGATAITVFNPSQRSDLVAVTVRPGTAPPATFTDTIAPHTAWVFDTSAQTRIPVGTAFLATVSVRSGPGVVVDRTVAGTRSLPGPQFGAVTGLSVGPAQPASSTALFPGPGIPAQPIVAGSQAEVLSVVNPGTVPIHATLWALVAGQGRVALGTMTVPAGSSVVFDRTELGKVGPLPLEVTADHPVLALEDLAPTASAGVVSVLGAASSEP